MPVTVDRENIPFNVKFGNFFVAGYETCNSQETTKIVVSLETTKQKLAEESDKLLHSVIQTDCLNQKVM